MDPKERNELTALLARLRECGTEEAARHAGCVEALLRTGTVNRASLGSKKMEAEYHLQNQALVAPVRNYLLRKRKQGEAQPVWTFDANTNRSAFGAWAVERGLFRSHPSIDGLTLLGE